MEAAATSFSRVPAYAGAYAAGSLLTVEHLSVADMAEILATTARLEAMAADERAGVLPVERYLVTNQNVGRTGTLRRAAQSDNCADCHRAMTWILKSHVTIQGCFLGSPNS